MLEAGATELSAWEFQHDAGNAARADRNAAGETAFVSARDGLVPCVNVKLGLTVGQGGRCFVWFRI